MINFSSMLKKAIHDEKDIWAVVFGKASVPLIADRSDKDEDMSDMKAICTFI